MTKQASHPSKTLAGALAAGLAISSLLLSIVVAQETTTVEPTETSEPQFDAASISDHAALAQQGTIFFARVSEVVLIRTEKETSPDELFPKIIYAVDVEQSLRGDATGKVRVSFLDPRLSLKRKEASGPLTIGERYLFFAGSLTSQDYYPVDLEYGFVAVRDDQHAQELAIEFAPLIQQAEEEERVLSTQLAEAARTESILQPVATIAPSRVAAGSQVTVSGSGFTPAEMMLFWGEGSVDVGAVQDDGQFQMTVTVPKSLRPGKHEVHIEGSGSDRAEVTLVVE